MKEKTILFQYNIDSYGNPTSTKIKEVAQVSPLKYTIQLEQIPDEQFGVTLLNSDNTSMFQVFNYDDVEKTENSYYVNYTNGLIYFNSKQGAEKKVINYYGTGVELISCKRVFDGHYDANGKWIVEILQDIIDAGREAIEAMKTIGDVTIILQMLEDKIAEGDLKLQKLQNAIDEANDLTKITENERIIIDASNWIYNPTTKMYEYTIAHTMNSTNLIIDCYNNDTNEFVFCGGKIIDASSVLIQHDEAINLKVILNARYFKVSDFDYITEDLADKLQDVIDEANDLTKVTGNEVVIINAGDWVYNPTNKMYEHTINHAMNSKDLIIDCYNLATGDFVLCGGKIENNDSVLIKSETNIDLKVVLNARYYKATLTISDDIAREVVDARKTYETVGKRLDNFDSQLDTIAQTNKTLSINLVDYKKYATLVNDKLDWSTAFNKIIEEIKSYENKSLTIKLPSDNLFINNPIVFDGIPSVTLIGDNIYNCRITPSSNLTVNDFIFTFKPKNANGGAISGLSISNIWFDMGNSECGGVKCSSLNDNVNFTNLHFRNITGNAFKLVTRDSTTPLAYNFIEGVNFDKVTIIGIEKSIRMTNKSLIEITSETDDIGGANEIYFYRCKFYCNPTTHDKSLLNSRKAIKGDVYTKGWAITECAFVSNVDNDFIQIGSDTQPSEGHRIYSNMFENFHENGEGWGACINLKNRDKNISNAHNFIGYNRFEYPCGLKYKYRIFTSNTTVFEPFLKVSEVSIPQGSYGNNIMVFGDTNLGNYRNQVFSGNGQGYEISSKLSVMSRNDSDSNEIKNINPKITLDDLVDGVVKNRLEIKSSNYYYDSVENGYVDFNQNGVNAFYIYKGCYHVGKRDNPPENINGGCIYFNNQTKKFMGFNGTSWVELG